MSQRDWSEFAAAYALGALEGEEREAFEAQLARDPGLVAEVRSYENVAGLIGEAHAPKAPPEHLKQRILDRARGVVPLPERSPKPPSPADPDSADRAPSATTGELAGTGRDGSGSTKGPIFRMAPWLAAAAALVVSFGTWNAYREADLDRTRLLSEVEALRESVARESGARTQGEAVLTGLLGPEVHSVSLATEGQPPAARVYWNHTEDLFVVTAFDLPPAPDGSTYQLWAIAEGQAPVSMGTFDTDDSGSAALTLPVDPDIRDLGLIALCGLTLEPTGGSTQPTEQPRLIGAWRHAE